MTQPPLFDQACECGHQPDVHGHGTRCWVWDCTCTHYTPRNP